MEKKLKSYETLFVINAELSEEDTKAVVEKFTALISQHGEIEEVNEWGKSSLTPSITRPRDITSSSLSKASPISRLSLKESSTSRTLSFARS